MFENRRFSINKLTPIKIRIDRLTPAMIALILGIVWGTLAAASPPRLPAARGRHAREPAPAHR